MIPNSIKTMLRDDARKYPYALGRYASAARILAEHRRTAARLAALPAELRDAYKEAAGCWFDAIAVDLPHGARLVCEIQPDDINPLEDCYTLESVRSVDDPTDYGAGCGYVQTRRNKAPRMLYHAGRYDWRWIEACQAGPLDKEAIHYRTRGASRSVALDLARESAIRGLNYARQVKRPTTRAA